MKAITIITHYNLYESKRYFAECFGKALERHEINVHLLAADRLSTLSNDELSKYFAEVDLTCSFNTMLPSTEGHYPWEFTGIPHWFIIVDPAYYYTQMLKIPGMIFSCVDRYDCDYVRFIGQKKVFFWPHAVEKELSPNADQDRPFDVVFIGSCYDHVFLREYWQKSLTPEICKVIDDAVEIVLGDSSTPLLVATSLSMKKNKIDPSNEIFRFILYYVDNYMRGKDRWELITSIKDAEVHVWGDLRFSLKEPVHSWSDNLKGYNNIVVHPPVNFQESLNILKQSKICLNSMPFFKNGTHERIFTGLACGSLPITTENLWVNENFRENEELVLYRSGHWEEVNDKVNTYLKDESLRRAVVDRGREKVMQEHTWDARIPQFLRVLSNE